MPDITVDMRNQECPVTGNLIQVDCRGQTCPVPLVEVRKAIRRANAGDTIQVLGTHPASKKEIPMAVAALGLELVSVEGSDTDWRIVIRR